MGKGKNKAKPRRLPPGWWIAIVVAVIAVLGGSGNENYKNWRNAPQETAPDSPASSATASPDLAIRILTPVEGAVVHRPTDVTGKIVGRAPEADERLSARRRGSSFYYMNGLPCEVCNQAFTCSIFLGTPEGAGLHNLCILLPDDRKPFPDPDYRRIPPADLSIVTSTCVSVST